MRQCERDSQCRGAVFIASAVLGLPHGAILTGINSSLTQRKERYIIDYVLNTVMSAMKCKVEYRMECCLECTLYVECKAEWNEV